MHGADKRTVMVKHDIGGASRFEDTAHFLHGTLNVRRVMQHSERVHNIKRVVREVQSLGVGRTEINRDITCPGESASDVNGRIGQIDRSHLESSPGELHAVYTDSAPNLQQLSAFAVQ